MNDVLCVGESIGHIIRLSTNPWWKWLIYDQRTGRMDLIKPALIESINKCANWMPPISYIWKCGIMTGQIANKGFKPSLVHTESNSPCWSRKEAILIAFYTSIVTMVFKWIHSHSAQKTKHLQYPLWWCFCMPKQACGLETLSKYSQRLLEIWASSPHTVVWWSPSTWLAVISSALVHLIPSTSSGLWSEGGT